MKTSQAQLGYCADVEGLRALAVIGVVFCHGQLAVPGGFIGVDVFFVISGYLITRLILNELSAGRFSLSDFCDRRIRRIVPPVLVLTVVVQLAGWFVLFPDAYKALGKSIVSVSLVAANIHFFQTTGYFSESSEQQPLLHLWSLAVEEQFYIIIPLFFFGLNKVRQRNKAFPLLVLTGGASLALSVYGVEKFPVAAFYLLPTRAWELIAGCLLAYRQTTWLADQTIRKEVVATVGLLGILLPCFLFNEKTPFPGFSAVPVVFGTALLILAGINEERPPFVNRLLSLRQLGFVGAISYSFYLWHWPLFVYARYAEIEPLSVGRRWLLIGVSFLMAILSWKYIEQPFRKRLIFRSAKSVFWGATVFGGLLLVAGISLDRHNGFDSRMSAQTSSYLKAANERAIVLEMSVSDVPENLVRLGGIRTPAKVLISGDSHAMALVPAFESLCKETGVGAFVATHSSTAPVLEYFQNSQYGLGEDSIAFNAAVIDFIRTSGINAVVMVATWENYFEGKGFGPALLKTIDCLNSLGVSVHFMRRIPISSYFAPRVLAIQSLRGKEMSSLSMSEQDYRNQNPSEVTVLSELKKRNVEIIDPLSAFLSASEPHRIYPFDSTGALYRDANHVSRKGALRLQPLLARAFKSNLNGLISK